MIDFTRTYDVVVAGGGNAAISAAVTARQRGASVLVLESAPRPFRGGNSRHTRNIRVMHDAPVAHLVEAYGEDEYWEDLLRVTGGKTDEPLARMTIRESQPTLQWMLASGIAFQPSLTGTLSLSRTNSFFLGGGKALLNTYYALAERLGVDICYDAEVRVMRLRDGTVTEAEVVAQGFPYTVRGKAYVAAAGGFQANIDWLKKYWGDAADNFLIRGTPYAKGRLLENLLAQGVAPIGDPTQCHAVAIDARAPKFDGGIASRSDSVPFGVVVNRDAQRFYDEGEDFWPKRYAIWGRLIAQQPGQIAYSIVDSKAATLFMPSLFAPVEAGTLEDLAGKLGLDAASLTATVGAFNASLKPGTFNPVVLDDCGTAGLVPPKTHWARSIERPPFFAYPLRPGITFTYLGVKVDAAARVVQDNGRGCSNLFAAGEMMAGNILGKGYLAGFGMTIGSVFGRIAGREAASHAGH